ncbi:hypothetical protein [Methylocystis sp. B8]|uniref:hypothetical protein n=1 Tax=Methylocystis sp. B8 TaxID=544938 RepID=UPI0010FDCEBE|nr:hypothetical protein [Methylocystis sp. B8]TLG71828.1 hypothetical protein FEV16_15130 [Methylocystis sp. B8]
MLAEIIAEPRLLNVAVGEMQNGARIHDVAVHQVVAILIADKAVQPSCFKIMVRSGARDAGN